MCERDDRIVCRVCWVKEEGGVRQLLKWKRLHIRPRWRFLCLIIHMKYAPLDPYRRVGGFERITA